MSEAVQPIEDNTWTTFHVHSLHSGAESFINFLGHASNSGRPDTGCGSNFGGVSNFAFPVEITAPATVRELQREDNRFSCVMKVRREGLWLSVV